MIFEIKEFNRDMPDEIYERADRPRMSEEDANKIITKWNQQKEAREQETEWERQENERNWGKEGARKAIAKTVFKTGLSTAASIAGVKFFYDAPKWMIERWRVRGFLGSGGLEEDLNKLVRDKEQTGEFNRGIRAEYYDEKGQLRTGKAEVIRGQKERAGTLEKRLQASSGSAKGSMERKIIAEIIRRERNKGKLKKDGSREEVRSIAEIKAQRRFDGQGGFFTTTKDLDYFREEAEKELSAKYKTDIFSKADAPEQLQRILFDEYIQTKTSEARVLKEGLNTALVLATLGGGGILKNISKRALFRGRGISYFVMEGWEKFRELKRQGAIGGEKVSFFNGVIWDSVVSTLRDLNFGGEGNTLKKTLAAIAAGGRVLRLGGILGAGELVSEASIEKVIKFFEENGVRFRAPEKLDELIGLGAAAHKSMGEEDHWDKLGGQIGAALETAGGQDAVQDGLGGASINKAGSTEAGVYHIPIKNRDYGSVFDDRQHIVPKFGTNSFETPAGNFFDQPRESSPTEEVLKEETQRPEIKPEANETNTEVEVGADVDTSGMDGDHEGAGGNQEEAPEREIPAAETRVVAAGLEKEELDNKERA